MEFLKLNKIKGIIICIFSTLLTLSTTFLLGKYIGKNKNLEDRMEEEREKREVIYERLEKNKEIDNKIDNMSPDDIDRELHKYTRD